MAPLYHTSTGHKLIDRRPRDDGLGTPLPPENRLLQGVISDALLVLAVLLLAVAAYFVGEVVTHPTRERQRAVRRAADYGRDPRRRSSGSSASTSASACSSRLRRSLARIVLRLNPRVTLESISARLLAAGIGRTLTPTTFLAAKGAGALAGGFLGLLHRRARSAAPTMGLMLAIGLAAGGFIAPGIRRLDARSRARREEIRAQLPDALDLLAVSVEAGLGFDGAVDKLTEHMDGAARRGVRAHARRDADRRVAATTRSRSSPSAPATPEVACVHARDHPGRPARHLARAGILRVQAADSRLKRQAAAEEKAMKAPIKMLFPTVIFIFPAMFIVILGPAFSTSPKLVLMAARTRRTRTGDRAGLRHRPPRASSSGARDAEDGAGRAGPTPRSRRRSQRRRGRAAGRAAVPGRPSALPDFGELEALRAELATGAGPRAGAPRRARELQARLERELAIRATRRACRSARPRSTAAQRSSPRTQADARGARAGARAARRGGGRRAAAARRAEVRARRRRGPHEPSARSRSRSSSAS